MDAGKEKLIDLDTIIKKIYLIGLTTLTLWESILKDVMHDIVNDDEYDEDLVKILKEIKLCVEICRAKTKTYGKGIEFNIETIKVYLEQSVLNFHEPQFKQSSANKFYSLVEKSLNKQTKSNHISKKRKHNDNESDSDESASSSDSDSETDFFKRMYGSCGVNENKKKRTFVQSFSLLKDGVNKIVSTPGERGSYLIKIEVTDTRDIKDLAVAERWRKVAKKAVFLTSPIDENYLSIKKILKNVVESISKIDGIKKESKNYSKFNPSNK